MIKEVCYTAIAALLTISLSGCKKILGSTEIEFNEITVSKTVVLEKDGNSPKCEVSLKIHQATNATNDIGRKINAAIVRKIFDMDDIGIQEAADSFASLYTSEYRKNMAPLYRVDRSDSNKRPWYEYRYSVATETRHDAENITNYIIALDYYEGGAHGIKQLLTINFDDKTGETLTLRDIYGEDYESRITEQLLQALFKKTDCKDIEQLRQQGYLYSMDMFVPENYIIADNEITFIFNPYEIAPYSEGCIELVIER